MVTTDYGSFFLGNLHKNKKDEYKKNDDFFKKLMTNKSEKEKFARENYFMKKPNEEIFILVADSSAIKRNSEKK